MDYLEVHRSNRSLTHLLHREKEVYNRLLKMSATMTSESYNFASALKSIMDHLDPDLGWLSCRITNMLPDGGTITRMNPQLPKDPELDLLWHEIDLHSSPTDQEILQTEFITTGGRHPEYAHLIVPIRGAGKTWARIELIYPDHRRMDSRIREVFDLMAVNLAIVAERELLNIDLKRRALHDPLTGAVNRTLFIEELTKAITEANPLNPDSVLLFLDLDGFKEVNDNFGHQIGDRLLIEVTERLSGICREKDVLGRLSGDEFVLLVRDIDVSDDLEHLLKRIQRSLLHPFMMGDLEIRIETSIGATILDRRDLGTPELLRRSEEAMYLVKNGERKGYCIADAQIIKEFKTRFDMDHKIHEAFFQKRLLLHFQPIVDLRTGDIFSAEALFRIVDTDGRILNAAGFISSLERIRLMPNVDEWVFAEALSILRQHLDPLMSIPGFSISLNVSPPILSTHDYGSTALNRIKSSGLSPSMICLEIIENHLDTTNKSLLENISILRNAGVNIAVDDFGTGYSNLQHLTSIPFDTLKIDRMFIKGISSGDAKSKELLAAIVNLGRNLGYSLIAEGIERQEEADYLLSLGCHHGQGYLYGKPMSIEELIEYAKKHSPNILRLSGKPSTIPTAQGPSEPVMTAQS
jgi:diguanylate cyclase (GGDEF)-like protein